MAPTPLAYPIGHQPHHGRLWWSFLVSGLLLIGFGVVIFFVPKQATRLVTTLLGTLAIFLGLTLIASSLSVRRAIGRFGLGIAPGIVFVAIGVATVIFADFVSKFLVVAWAVIALLGGAWDAASALMNPQSGRGWRLTRGILLIAAGAAFLISPALGVAAAGILIGLVCVLAGGTSLAIAYTTRQTGI